MPARGASSKCCAEVTTLHAPGVSSRWRAPCSQNSALRIRRGSDDAYSVPGVSSRWRMERHRNSARKCSRHVGTPNAICLAVLRNLRLRVATLSAFARSRGAKHNMFCAICGDPVGVCEVVARTKHVLRHLRLRAATVSVFGVVLL